MDQKELETWLNTRPREDAILIAQRAALRVWPIWGAAMREPWVRKRDLTNLPILRSNLTSGIARKYPTPEVEVAADAAFESTADATVSDADARAFDASFAARVARVASAAFAAFVDFSAARAAPRAARAAASAAALANLSAFATVSDARASDASFAARAALAAFAARAASDFTAARPAIWTNTEQDVLLLQSRGDLLRAPLWHSDVPVSLLELEQIALETLARETGSRNSFWHRWYEGAKRGEWLDWELQKAVALLPEDAWNLSPAEVEREIAKIEAEFAAKGNPAKASQRASTRLAVVGLQVQSLRVVVDAEWEIIRATNDIAESEQSGHTKQIEILGRLRDLIAEIENALNGNADHVPGTELIVVNQKLPAVIEAAEELEAVSRVPQPSVDILAIAASTKVLTESGMPGAIASRVVAAEWVLRKLNSYFTRDPKK